MQGSVSVKKYILDSYNQLKQCDLSKKTLYIDIIQSLTGADTGAYRGAGWGVLGANNLPPF